MNNTQLFYESFIHAPHTILGVKLKPHSLLHLLWLYASNNPFVGNGSISVGDLEKAVLICSSSSSEEIQHKLSVNTERGSISHLKLWLWRIRNRRQQLKKFKQQVEAFQEYGKDYVALPELTGSGKEHEEKMPWLLMHVAQLVSYTGWDIDKVLSMEIGKALWLCHAIRYYQTGQTNVNTDSENNIIAMIRARKAAERAALTARG